MEITMTESVIPRRKELDVTSSAILRTILYFDIFNYPLTSNELAHYCQLHPCGSVEMKRHLYHLVEAGHLEENQGFYFLPGKHSLVSRRIKGNLAAAAKMVQARRISKFISYFPFVESISISGSLSKNYMEKDSDIDFFIITKPQRLWLCRGLLVCFKKFFLLNSSRHFCINYYLDSNNLQIPDQNIFTATEIMFLKPTYRHELFQQFIAMNDWCRAFYPNMPPNGINEVDVKSGAVKRFWELMLSGWLGERLDAFFFRITLNRWKRKFNHFNASDFDLNMRSRKHVSKHHPRGYQKKVLEAFEQGQQNFEMQFNVKLSAKAESTTMI